MQSVRRSIKEDEVRSESKAWRESLRQKRLATRNQEAADEEQESRPDSRGWKDDLIARLLELSADGFERLAQRILREAGFVNVLVTGKGGDGGIDGLGTYRLSLVSFPVYFQCKRYKRSVTPGTVRDFRGAMAGRGERGLLITTGSFTRDARREASRDGAPPVELIDGDRLKTTSRFGEAAVANQAAGGKVSRGQGESAWTNCVRTPPWGGGQRGLSIDQRGR